MDLKKLVNYNIKTNSKEIVKNDVFLAIGKGHDYIDETLKKGVKYIISERKHKSKKIIKVNSSLETLGVLAKLKRNKYKIPLIAITGSCGKTTTKEFIYQLLCTKYKVLKNEKNENNHIGMPNTLLKLNDEIDIVVVELGMNHLKEISYLSNICKPNCSVITNIGTAHIGNLGSKKNILKAKLEILEGMEDGILIINENDKNLKRIKSNKVNIVKKMFKVKKIKYYSDYTTFNIHINNKKYSIIFNIPGKHMLEDLIISIKVALVFGIDMKKITKEVEKLKNNEGRFKIYNGEVKLIDDSYNSSFEALKESLNYLKKLNGKKIIILSDMLELGDFSLKYHKKINKYLNKIKNKEVYLYGELTKVINGKHFKNLEEVKNNININKNDTIFIKGSHSTKIYELSDYIKEIYSL